MLSQILGDQAETKSEFHSIPEENDGRGVVLAEH